MNSQTAESWMKLMKNLDSNHPKEFERFTRQFIDYLLERRKSRSQRRKEILESL